VCARARTRVRVFCQTCIVRRISIAHMTHP